MVERSPVSSPNCIPEFFTEVRFLSIPLTKKNRNEVKDNECDSSMWCCTYNAHIIIYWKYMFLVGL